MSQSESMKKVRRVAAPLLVDALYKWMCTQNNQDVLLNADIVKMQGHKLMDAVNALLPQSKQLW